jgi:hypothetical protein
LRAHAAAYETWKRAQGAKRLGKSVATVRRLEGVELFPTLDEDGTHRFDPAEVELLAAKMDRAPPSHSSWLRAELARRAEEEADEREHATRLTRQRAEADAFHRSLAEQRACEDRDQREHQRRALEQARAQVESVRQDLALEIARASHETSADSVFMRTLEDLFGAPSSGSIRRLEHLAQDPPESEITF